MGKWGDDVLGNDVMSVWGFNDKRRLTQRERQKVGVRDYLLSKGNTPSSSTHTIVSPQPHGGDDLTNPRRSPADSSACWCQSDEMVDDGLINMHQWFSHRPSLHSLDSMWLQLPPTRRGTLDGRPDSRRRHRK